MKIPLTLPDDLHPDTKSLVLRFAEALAQKLHKAEKKYDYSDGWTHTEWIENGECRVKLLEHVEKGDPRDVAAYCAFLWHHGASTADAAPRSPSDTEMLNWLIAGGYAPAAWRSATREECRAGRVASNGMVNIGPPSRETIRAAMARK